jgi:uncharacterized SAM-binding protein YcdF (DUF218 family)
MDAMKGPVSANPPAGSPAGGSLIGHSGRRPRTFLRKAVLAFCLTVLLFFGGFALFSAHVTSLTAPSRLAGADAIIVLTGGQSRIDAAVDLLKSGKGRRLLISGVHPAADRDDLRSATGADRRLFTCCVDIDHVALNTIGNAEESAKWIRSHDFERVILVTSNYHMPRSLLEMRRLLGASDLEPYPVVNSDLGGGVWLTKPDALRVLFTEYNKYLLALARGVVPRTTTPVPFGVARATAADH